MMVVGHVVQHAFTKTATTSCIDDLFSIMDAYQKKTHVSIRKIRKLPTKTLLAYVILSEILQFAIAVLCLLLFL